jgi:hypothetical protein
MQKTIMIAGRLMFAGIIMALCLALFVGVMAGFVVKSGRINRLETNLTEPGGVVLATSNLANGESELGSAIDNKVVTDDARPLLIKRYLEKYKSTLVPYADLIFKLSETYGFPYYWIVAIGQQESNLCKKIPENSFNCWGYGINSAGTLRFDNYELALKSYAEYLKRAYFDKGLNTPELIMKKYCPHSNGSWAFGVQHFIDEIESGSF